MSKHPEATVADEVVAKANAFHHEEVVEELDHEMSPWQCLRQNPKIVAWSLFANSE